MCSIWPNLTNLREGVQKKREIFGQADRKGVRSPFTSLDINLRGSSLGPNFSTQAYLASSKLCNFISTGPSSYSIETFNLLIIWLLIIALSLFVSEPIIELLSNDQYHLLHCTSIIFHNNLVAPFQGEISEDILTVTDVIIIITWFVWLSGITPRKAPKIIKKKACLHWKIHFQKSFLELWITLCSLAQSAPHQILPYLSYSQIFVTLFHICHTFPRDAF